MRSGATHRGVEERAKSIHEPKGGMQRMIRDWDHGNKNARVRILRAFIAANQQAHEDSHARVLGDDRSLEEAGRDPAGTADTGATAGGGDTGIWGEPPSSPRRGNDSPRSSRVSPRSSRSSPRSSRRSPQRQTDPPAGADPAAGPATAHTDPAADCAAAAATQPHPHPPPAGPGKWQGLNRLSSPLRDRRSLSTASMSLSVASSVSRRGDVAPRGGGGAAASNQLDDDVASLLFSRLTSWLRLTYVLGFVVPLQLRAINLFMSSNGGSSRFPSEFIEAGGIITVLEILGSASSSDASRARDGGEESGDGVRAGGGGREGGGEGGAANGHGGGDGGSRRGIDGMDKIGKVDARADGVDEVDEVDGMDAVRGVGGAAGGKVGSSPQHDAPMEPMGLPEELEKQWALRVVSTIAFRGRAFKELLNECGAVSTIVRCIVASRDPTTVRRAQDLLVDLGTGNPTAVGDVNAGLLHMFACSNPLAQRAAAQTARRLISPFSMHYSQRSVNHNSMANHRRSMAATVGLGSGTRGGIGGGGGHESAKAGEKLDLGLGLGDLGGFGLGLGPANTLLLGFGSLVGPLGATPPLHHLSMFSAEGEGGGGRGGMGMRTDMSTTVPPAAYPVSSYTRLTGGYGGYDSSAYVAASLSMLRTNDAQVQHEAAETLRLLVRDDGLAGAIIAGLIPILDPMKSHSISQSGGGETQGGAILLADPAAAFSTNNVSTQVNTAHLLKEMIDAESAKERRERREERELKTQLEASSVEAQQKGRSAISLPPAPPSPPSQPLCLAGVMVEMGVVPALVRALLGRSIHLQMATLDTLITLVAASAPADEQVAYILGNEVLSELKEGARGAGGSGWHASAARMMNSIIGDPHRASQIRMRLHHSIEWGHAHHNSGGSGMVGGLGGLGGAHGFMREDSSGELELEGEHGGRAGSARGGKGGADVDNYGFDYGDFDVGGAASATNLPAGAAAQQFGLKVDEFGAGSESGMLTAATTPESSTFGRGGEGGRWEGGRCGDGEDRGDEVESPSLADDDGRAEGRAERGAERGDEERAGGVDGGGDCLRDLDETSLKVATLRKAAMKKGGIGGIGARKGPRAGTVRFVAVPVDDESDTMQVSGGSWGGHSQGGDADFLTAYGVKDGPPAPAKGATGGTERSTSTYAGRSAASSTLSTPSPFHPLPPKMRKKTLQARGDRRGRSQGGRRRIAPPTSRLHPYMYSTSSTHGGTHGGSGKREGEGAMRAPPPELVNHLLNMKMNYATSLVRRTPSPSLSESSLLSVEDEGFRMLKEGGEVGGAGRRERSRHCGRKGGGRFRSPEDRRKEGSRGPTNPGSADPYLEKRKVSQDGLRSPPTRAQALHMRHMGDAPLQTNLRQNIFDGLTAND